MSEQTHTPLEDYLQLIQDVHDGNSNITIITKRPLHHIYKNTKIRAFFDSSPQFRVCLLGRCDNLSRCWNIKKRHPQLKDVESVRNCDIFQNIIKELERKIADRWRNSIYTFTSQVISNRTQIKRITQAPFNPSQISLLYMLAKEMFIDNPSAELRELISLLKSCSSLVGYQAEYSSI